MKSCLKGNSIFLSLSLTHRQSYRSTPNVTSPYIFLVFPSPCFRSPNILLLIAIIIVTTTLVIISIGVVIKRRKSECDSRKRKRSDRHDDGNGHEKVEMEEK